MTPTQALALQRQPNQLPPRWGDSFATEPFRPRATAMRRESASAPYPHPSGVAGALLAELTRIADRGETLPMPCLTTLARRIGIPADERTPATVARALQTLVERGDIAHWSGGLRGPHHGQRVITLLATGREIRTPGAPDTVRLG